MASSTFPAHGPFDLKVENEFFGGWPTLAGDDGALVMAFPVEGWQASGAVVVRQDADRRLDVEVHGARGHEQQAVEQALAALSLDVDGRAWPDVGERDAHMGRLQRTYHFLRPVLFNSPYEAAASFVIGHRISMKQGRAIRGRMAESLGTRIEVGGEAYAAFPDPERLLALSEFKGLNSTKIERLHGVAEAALDGILDRARLRALRLEDAAAELRRIDGIGPFFASGILHRGAGVVDDVTDDDLTKHAAQIAYALAEPPSHAEVLRIAEQWRPYRTWATVLLHVWLRREVGLPRRRR